ncbi:MAG: NigD-like protein [Prolixibacteraceae bacterium]|jgi:hypothetical protein|nr:NigD-like N-terminal domain-containing protein [Prolixibacteraceae bacterium]MDI9565161.1 NigD-like protein [Bacteroidota bacterium]OQB81327.1 MAG: NigD-like protein [Bacteroidetes bacterium ADurb.Bin123]HNU76759.1 NigD-like protein [Prolixibacteraceae bacterium]HOF56355.1 NigD-like protein [Prolixibacteraceae bacterium]
MRRLIIAVMAAGLVLMTSCLTDDDHYSLDKMWIGLGMADKGSDDGFKIEMDDGSVLFPAVKNFNESQLEDSDRVLVNYTILGDKVITELQKEYYVRINSIRKILKKGILDITPAIADSIGNDPVTINKVWLSRNQLLNFEFHYFGESKVHYINLVKEPGDLHAEDQPIKLELRHNSNGDAERFPMTSLVSFDLKAIRIVGLDSVAFHVTSQDYDGEEHTFDGVYHY